MFAHSGFTPAPNKLLRALRRGLGRPARTSLLVVLFAAYGISLSSFAQQPEPTPRVKFSIDPQRADSALTEFAKQANTTLLFPFELAKEINANALEGEFTLQEGLQRLLHGTPLAVQVDQSGLLSIKAKPLEEEPPPEQIVRQESNQDYGLERIAVVGTRSAPRSSVDSAVPLDVIGNEHLATRGETNVLDMVKALVPSLNVNDQPINDATSLVRPANLRGMASDHTLVLMNGKRRHRSAVITFLGGGLSDGAQGPDISVFPAAALQQVEVLRDGAAAQYGSDAIAGVINFVLKNDRSGGALTVQTGQYGAGDGEMLQVQGNIGLPLAETGFLNITGEYRHQQPTNRSVQRGDASELIAQGNTAVADPAQIWGALEVNRDMKLAINSGGKLTSNSHWYAFGNIAQREIEGGFYFRNPQTRVGVFASQPDERGTQYLLIADADGEGGIDCPLIPLTDQNILDDPLYAQVAATDTAVGQNCFAFNEWFAGGFTPRFGGLIEDAALTAGVNGATRSGWDWDLSASIGYSNIEYELHNTVNPSLGASSPLSFKPGAVSQVERTLNFDVVRQITNSFGEPVNVALGAEWRSETYFQKAGDEASWTVGPFALQTLPDNVAGFSVGSNGFPGYQPMSAGHWTRNNWALYSDVEVFINAQAELGLAARVEHFTDFGTTFDGKVSLRYQVDDVYALRGSVSTGFKAPTVGQSNVINITTAYSAQGLEDQATLPPTHPISRQLGATALTPEESINSSFGVVAYWDSNAYLTVDYFNIRLNDRISTTSAIPLTPLDRNFLIAMGYPEAERISSAKYFTNDFDTQTQGIDAVFHYKTKLADIDTQVIAAYNWTDTQVDRVSRYAQVTATGDVIETTNLTAQRIRMLEDNLPAHRGSISVMHWMDEWMATWRVNYYGSFYEDHLDASAGMDIESGDMWTVDAEFSWQFSPLLTIAIGATNLFDARPQVNPYKEVVGALYPPTSPAGINGGFYYLRAALKWSADR